MRGVAAGAPEAAHYPRASERVADKWTHWIGLSLLGAGGVALVVTSLVIGSPGQSVSVGVYVLCVVAAITASLAYNLAGERRRPLLRRLDHAGIFLMIAGSYTPFTTQSLTGAWAIAMSTAIWVIAAFGAVGKLVLPGIGRGLWIPVYLALGWLGVIAVEPMIGRVPAIGLVLLVGGGVIYSTGVLVYLNKGLPYRRAIWHGFVIAAAAAHYGAVLTGVILPAAGQAL
jgi:hemolysin III